MRELTNYELLFGDLDFRQGDEARSVTSPAAYLVDLLRLLDEEIDGATLLDRRSDIQDILLDAQNTSTERPYLEVVVEILKKIVGDKPYEQLRTAQYPFDKPFQLAYEQLGVFLKERGVGREELPRLFGAAVDVLAAEALGLSPEMVDVVTVPRPNERDQREFYKTQKLTDLEDVERFRATVGLTEVELTELLAGTFTGVKGRLRVTLDWLDRVNRFVRLARRTGLAFGDLDLVLHTCCGDQLNLGALRVLAAVRHVAETMELPIDVVVSLAYPAQPATVAPEVGAAELDRVRARFAEAHVASPAPQALQRAARLMTALGTTADELFDLLKVMDGTVPVPFAMNRGLQDCRVILAEPEVESGLWLAQALPPLVRWMRANGLSAQDLADFAGGPADHAKEDKQLAAALEERLAAVRSGPQLFVSPRFSRRASRAIFDALPGATPYAALVGMADVTKADFLGLGLGDPIAVKIFTNLVLRGYLTADGSLVEEPRELAGDFAAYRDKVADLLTRLGDFCYPSDLESLPELTQQQRDELYDNLAYNGYLGQGGEILDADVRHVNAELEDVAEPVVELIRSRAATYAAEPLKIDLGFEIDGLLDNLEFNGHIDADGHYRDKRRLAELDYAEFALAAAFEPRKADILYAIQRQLALRRAELCTFLPEAFSEIADNAAAQRVIDAGWVDLPVTIGRVQAIEREQRRYRLDPDKLLDLGFTEEERDGLLTLLYQAGDLNESLAIPEDRLEFFCEPTSVLDFNLPGMTDFIEDVFALMHAAAPELRAGTEEIAAAIAAQHKRQEAALLAVAQEAFGVPATIVRAICAAMDAELTDLIGSPGLVQRRVRAFARLAAKAGLSAAEIGIAFDDLKLAARFPEPLALPAGVGRIDALLESADGYTYLFSGGAYWRYKDRAVVDSFPVSALHKELRGVDAAFKHPSGAEWLVSGSRAYVREPGGTRWAARDQAWGRVKDAFTDPKGGKIRAALVDEEGRTYLFCGDQYVRYSTTDFGAVDEGFPRPAAEFGELGFQGKDGAFHAFAGADFAGAPAALTGPPDAAFADATGVYVFKGGHVARHTAALENEDLHVDDGFPVKIETRFPTVPAEFESGVEAAFTDAGGVLHLFKDGRTVALKGSAEVVATATRWGTMPQAFPSEHVDSAFVGLDGRTYLFSGGTYIRYSSADYSRVDLGYPRAISPDWGGLTGVDASFVLDGETYLFGGGQYVRYSTGDYSKPDEGYPQPMPGNFWNLPDSFGTTVDAVFTGEDGLTYLFRQDRYVVFDARRRWWSAPRKLSEDWDSLPFPSVDAAFVGRDGRTYVFSGRQYVRYTTGDHSRVDDRYPAPVAAFWGRARNNLARTGRVDAALPLDGHTYLFSGDQYIRYTGTVADLGYPRAVADLKAEPRLANLAVELDGVDAAFADKGNVYLLRGTTCHVVSESLYRVYDAPDVGCAYVEDGVMLVEGKAGWRRHSGIEALGVVTGPVRPRALRDVPEQFRSGLDAVLHGTDEAIYLFKGESCYNTLLDRAYPVSEAWGRPRGLGPIDAAFAGRDGKTYLFSGRQYSDGGPPRDIADVWGGLTGVAIAYVWQDATYLFEPPAEDGTMRYLVYSGTDYTAPDPGYPRTTDAGFWNIRQVPRAVLPVGDTLVLLGARTYTLTDGSLPRPTGLLWRGFEAFEEDLTAAYTDADGTAYFFFGERRTRYADGAFGPLTHPAADGFTRVDAAFTNQGRTYVFSGDRYARYSLDDYLYADPGYPKPISGNLRKEFPGLPESFEDELTTIDAVVGDRRNVHLFMGGRCHVVSRTLTAAYENLPGRTRPLTGRIDAALVIGEHTYLLSGDRYTRYTGDDYTTPDDGYPRAIASDLATDLGVATLPAEFEYGVDAGFAGGGIHLFKNGRYLRADRPQAPAPQWGRVRSAFDGGLDAAFAAPTGEVYAFRGDQFVRYTHDLDFADPGFPRTIKDDWGDLPVHFETGLDAAFTLAGQTYLVKGEEYVSGYRLARRVREGWADTADYRLADISTIIRFAALNQALGAALTTRDEDPYATMAGLFGWDKTELMWVQRTMPSTSDMDFALKAVELFALSRRVGAPPSKLAAVTGDPVLTLERDALLSAVLAGLGLHDSADLYEKLLIDVDMGAKGVTSTIREAIAAVQLYLHRYLLDLEPGGDEADRERLHRWWAWMKNYRVWEANRKVFLYPENYLRPELRDTKTPGFVELQNDLLQSGITSATAQRAYKRYLDEYTEVSRLAIAGGYVDSAEQGVRSLVLFGRTRTEPRRYYYRHATFRDGDKLAATWGPWLKVDVQIDAERVHPVRAFDRTFVFWASVENLPADKPDSTTIVATKQGDTQQVSAPAVRRCVKIYYSFLNLNQEWVPAQVLATGAPTTEVINQVVLAVRPGTLSDSDHGAIVVSYVALTPKGSSAGSYALTPELYTVKQALIVMPPQPGDVTTIFDDPVDPSSVVWFNRPAGFGDGSWFSVDHKGGSFLCRPLIPAPLDPPARHTFKTSSGFPSWDRVDAAVELPSGLRIFFDNTTGRYTTLQPGRTRVDKIQNIPARWGFTEPPTHTPPARPRAGTPAVPPKKVVGWTRVDAAWVEQGRYLFITGGKLLARYTLRPDGSVPQVVDAGYPKPIPKAVTAVFRGFAFSGADYARVADWQFHPTAGNWGELPEGITGALETATDLHLFFGTELATYPKKDGRPYLSAEVPHDIVRLTTSTAYKLNQRLLSGGVAALLDTAMQETDELPAFDTRRSDATTIRVRPDRVVPAWLPGRSHLDFHSANGIYYWEIFFHAPLLIAQSLNAAQRFEEARTWYEYVFDPTRSDQYWRFLPFLGADPGALAHALRAENNPALDHAIALLDSLVPVFRGIGLLSDDQRRQLADLVQLPPSEDLAVAAELGKIYDLMGGRAGLLDAYRDDPFDPHAIAALRPVAYRRAVVAGYIDNLIDWGDLLFRQYTMESVDEARMLYIFAHDLLGDRPENLGPLPLPATTSFRSLEKVPFADELVRVHSSVADPYFFTPVNGALEGYWDLVADRLTKIRASLDIMGVARPLPLFEPPIDPMALVERVAAGGAADLFAAPPVEVPHQRFAASLRRAQELADRARDFGSALLEALERRDGESLQLLQETQEAVLLDLTRAIKQAQVTAAEANLAATAAGRDAAQWRVGYYEQIIAEGLSPLQEAQVAMMALGAAAHLTAGGLKIGAAIAHGVPQSLIGPFIMGESIGGDQIGDALETGAEVSESLGEGLSMLGEVLGVRADQERQAQDWELQRDLAKQDVTQAAHQVAGAEAQLAAAQRELEVHLKQIANQEAVTAFLREKFTGAQLYQWMADRMSELYFAAYGMAYDAARAAERAYHFERGSCETMIKPVYWDSRRNGLLAAQSLTHDLDRLGKAYADADARRLEITRRTSLLELDPVALLTLRATGTCEFALTEEFLDHDFPGHYRRQLRAMAVSFVDAEGRTVTVNAGLSQTSHRTVLSADPKAVQYLLDPKGTPPESVRADWRAGQRIAVSHVPDGYENNGLFELRYDDERYLPFEGTGAVSTWRLDLPGLRTSDRPEFYDVLVTVRYSAEHGGDTFANTVRGLLKPYPAAKFFDVAADFPDAWDDFDGTLTLPITPDTLPDLYGRQITALYPAYGLTEEGAAQFSLNGTALPDGRLVPTPGLTVSDSGLALTFSGDREALLGLGLVVTYRAGIRGK
ncbi:hemopexin repeat-containing protein [Nonomuraea sediminis]|uniref:Tc toxin subunit A-related protein n=1 Tax=Nonomuraea sediminis TaxID=2835864 RepID=UPI001BDDC214|nr:hemopexin repeat-containing protein [Nonomuraea sediminis]